MILITRCNEAKPAIGTEVTSQERIVGRVVGHVSNSNLYYVDLIDNLYITHISKTKMEGVEVVEIND